MYENITLEHIENVDNLQTILNAIGDEVAIINRGHSILFENAHAIDVHGSNVGKKCYEIYAKRDDICPSCPCVDVFMSGDVKKAVQESFDSKGIKQYLEITASPLKNNEGITVAVVEVVRDVTIIKSAEKEKLKLIEELQVALEEIKVLRGFLPICSYCKSIRRDNGVWESIESYMHEHSEVEFSHGICPSCCKEHFPDFAKKLLKPE